MGISRQRRRKACPLPGCTIVSLSLTFPQSMLVPFCIFSFTFTFSSGLSQLRKREMSLAWRQALLGPLTEQEDKSLLFSHCPT